MIPLLHDFEGERVLVVGGGPVGARKARHFAREADVVAVSPAFDEADFGDAEQVRSAVDPADAADWLARVDPALVVTATDDEAVNDALAAAAEERGVLVNRADRSRATGEGRDPGSVVVPATVRDGPVVVSVGTGGRSPALSRYLREQLEPVVADAGEMAALTADLRAELRDEPPAQRRAAIRAVVRSDAVWKALDTGSPNVEKRARNVISDVIGDSA